MIYGNEVSIWAGMIVRCYDSTNKIYSYYGGRGIIVCDRWLHSMDAFIEDMGPRPSKQHSIDRINNNGNYEPSNCRWATKREQANNRRSNRTLTLNGRTQNLIQWANELGINPTTITQRLNAYGYDEKTALSQDSLNRKSITLTYNGKTQSIPEWSKEIGINRTTILMRVLAGHPPEVALSTARITNPNQKKPGRKPKMIEFDGRLQSIDEWANETGVKTTTLKRRIFQYGWSVERALTTDTVEPENRNKKGRPRKSKDSVAKLFISPRCRG